VAPPLELARRFGIAVVGCGGVARRAHLPAYRSFGLRVALACDTFEERARQLATDFDVPDWTTSIEDVLQRSDIDVVDLAVRVEDRPPLVESIARAGKHILSQKPFALTLREAKQMGECCEQGGVKLMVNQQARWAPAHRAARVLIDRGILGHVYSVVHLIRGFQDYPGSRNVAVENFNLADHGIHYFDLSRYFTKLTPVRVCASTTMVPGQLAVSPMIYSVVLDYEPQAQVMSTLHFNNLVSVRGMHSYEWFIDGTTGSIAASHSQLVLGHQSLSAPRLFQLDGNWFPDAFGAAMGELMPAIAEDREPATSGRDNLDTIRILESAIQSSRAGRTLDLISDFDGIPRASRRSEPISSRARSTPSVSLRSSPRVAGRSLLLPLTALPKSGARQPNVSVGRYRIADMNRPGISVGS